MKPLKLESRRPACGWPPPLPIHPIEAPFTRGLRRAAAGRADLLAFSRQLSDLEERVKAIPRLDDLRSVYSLYADYTEGEMLQIFCGNRTTFRIKMRDDVCALVAEEGPALVYALGPDGTIAIMLRPARSDLAEMREKVLFLGIGRFGFLQLADRLNGDLRALAAIGHVSSIDGTPALTEILHVWWLRTFHPHTTGEGFQPAIFSLKAGAVGRFMSKTIATAALNALFKPIAVILVVWWILTYRNDLASLVQGLH